VRFTNPSQVKSQQGYSSKDGNTDAYIEKGPCCQISSEERVIWSFILSMTETEFRMIVVQTLADRMGFVDLYLKHWERKGSSMFYGSPLIAEAGVLITNHI
jgi:hypothetical protein